MQKDFIHLYGFLFVYLQRFFTVVNISKAIFSVLRLRVRAHHLPPGIGQHGIKLLAGHVQPLAVQRQEKALYFPAGEPAQRLPEFIKALLVFLRVLLDPRLFRFLFLSLR
ncbi:MAG: hypothetical protein IJP78_02000 [Clostridia bacterium]|nr:hypothetical protein [Clostridia bacterium]